MCRLPLASFLVCLWLVEQGHGNGSLQDSMAELHSSFAISFYQTLTGTENNSNLIVSPLSVSQSLGLLQLGARGNTLAQMESTLGYNVKGGCHQTIVSDTTEKRKASLHARRMLELLFLL